MFKRNQFFRGAENDYLIRDSDLFDEVEPCCEGGECEIPININGVLYDTVVCDDLVEIEVLQDGVPVGSLVDGDWIVDPCLTECETLAAISDPITASTCITDEMAPAIGCQMILRPEFTSDVIVECIGFAGKTEEITALICGPGGNVEIIDQDSVIIDTVPCGDQYQVLVFSGIQDSGPIYINSIVDIP